MKNIEFIILESHLKLIKNMYFYFDECSYEGAPAVDTKKPYGNSNTIGDVYEILFDEYWDEDEKGEMPEEFRNDLYRLHKETSTALQICCVTQTFKPGLYVMKNSYDSLSWEFVKDI